MDSLEAVDLRIEAFASCQIQGASNSGKTTLALKIAQNRQRVYNQHHDTCYYYYKWYQPKFHEAKARDDSIIFINDIVELQEEIESNANSLLIIDDVLTQSSPSDIKLLTKLFLGGAHHYQCSLIHLSQLLFAKEGRPWQLNTNYYVFLKSFHQRQLLNFFRNSHPKQAKFLYDSYVFCTETKPFGHFFCSYHPKTPEHLRYRSSIIPGPDILIFRPKHL